MAEDLLRIVYVSKATRDVDASVLAELLGTAQRNNRRIGITGVLTCHDGSFLQILEGPPDAVDAIFARIGTDDRHRELILVERTPIARRAFARWAMGWVEHATLLRTGFDREALDPRDPSAPVLERMLRSFEQAMAS